MISSLMLCIMMMLCVDGLLTSHNTFRHINSNCLSTNDRCHRSLTQLTAEKLGVSDRSASVCVNEFFSSSGKLPVPVAGSHLSAVRMAGIEALNSAKLPFGKDEAWRYTNLKTLFLHPYAPASAESIMQKKFSESSIRSYIDASCVDSCMVFIDGVLSTSLSRTSGIPAEVTACSLNALDAAKCAEIGVEDMLKYVPDVKELPRNSYASDLITSLNSANVADVAVIHVPKGLDLVVPVQVLFISTIGADPTVSYPRLLVNVEDGASLHLKQSYASVSITNSNNVEEKIVVPSDEEAGLDVVNESGASLTVEVEDKSNVPTLVAANTRVVVGRNGSKVMHTYTQESASSNRHVEVMSVDINGDSR
jgi:hypothetical protein